MMRQFPRAAWKAIPRRWLIVGGLNVLADVSDVLTTWAATTSPTAIEDNPMFRDAAHHIVFMQGLVGKVSWDLILAACFVTLWWALEDGFLRWALDRATLIYVSYCTYDMFHTCVGNWYVHKGWYHP